MRRWTDLLQRRWSRLIRFRVHETETAGAVQGTTLRGRNHRPLRSLVLRYPLSLRQLKEMMAERNLAIDRVTIWRRVQRYAPELTRAFGKYRNQPPMSSRTGGIRIDRGELTRFAVFK